MSRADRLLSDLERGFEALEAGELEAAASVVERCKRIDRKHPDVVALAAAVADARGDTEDAIGEYRTLLELRPDDPMPRINIARLELHDIGDPDAALDTLEPAFDFIDEEQDLVDAIFVKTEALIAREDLDSARETLAELATSAIDDPEIALDLADLALAAEDPDAAKRWVEPARKSPELVADAMHLLGRIHEFNNDRDAMISAWKEVRRYDLAAPDGPLTITDDQLEEIALETLAELPPKIRQLLDKVPILIDSYPSEDIIEDGFDPRSLGFFQGTPMPEEGSGTPSVTNILLFKKNLERSAMDEDHLADEIRITVLHETAHYFGLDEDDLVALGLD